MTSLALAEPVESSLSGCADTARSGLGHRLVERTQIGKPDAALISYPMSLPEVYLESFSSGLLSIKHHYRLQLRLLSAFKWQY